MDIYPTKIYITKYTIGSICLKVNTEYDICSGKTSSLKMQEIRLCCFVGGWNLAWKDFCRKCHWTQLPFEICDPRMQICNLYRDWYLAFCILQLIPWLLKCLHFWSHPHNLERCVLGWVTLCLHRVIVMQKQWYSVVIIIT